MAFDLGSFENGVMSIQNLLYQNINVYGCLLQDCIENNLWSGDSYSRNEPTSASN